MKNSNNNFIYSSFKTLLIAIIIGIVGSFAAKAESDLNLDVGNGLFTPTQSDIFFQAGREIFEEEIAILNHPEQYWRDDLLQIAPELLEQMKDKQTLNLKFEDSQYKIYRDLE